jgi:hypothetical protein
MSRAGRASGFGNPSYRGRSRIGTRKTVLQAWVGKSQITKPARGGKSQIPNHKLQTNHKHQCHKQAPSTKTQITNKHQAPKPKSQTSTKARSAREAPSTKLQILNNTQ